MSTTVKRPEMPHPEGTEKTRTGITAFITQHAVPTYYGLAFAISWGGILLILGPDGLFSTVQRCRLLAAPHCSQARPSQASC